ERAYGLEIPTSLEEVCDPRRMALIVYAMQVGVLNQLDRRAEIIERVGEVLAAARHGGFRVLFLRHMSLPRELMGVSQFRMAMAWQRTERVDDVQPWFLRGPPGSDTATIAGLLRRSAGPGAS